VRHYDSQAPSPVGDTFGEKVTAAAAIGAKDCAASQHLVDLSHAHTVASGVGLVVLIPFHRLPFQHVLHTSRIVLQGQVAVATVDDPTVRSISWCGGCCPEPLVIIDPLP